MKEKENTPSGSTPGQASERIKGIWICPHGYHHEQPVVVLRCPKCLQAKVTEWKEAAQAEAQLADERGAEVVELREALTTIRNLGDVAHCRCSDIARAALSVDKADGERE